MSSGDENLVVGLGAVEARIAQIEAQLFSASQSTQSATTQSITSQLKSAQAALKKFAEAHPIVNEFWRAGKDFDRFLSVSCLDDLALNVAAKEEIFMAGLPQFQATAQLLEQVSILQPHLDAPVTAELPTLSKKLAPLQSINASQILAQSEQNERLSTLLSSYNEIMTSLSQSFIAWDQIITQAEKAAVLADS